MNRMTAALAFAAAAAWPFSAIGQGTGLPPGLSAHVQPVAGGRIDWNDGAILAEGKGIAETRDDQGQLMAERAATVDASRNALAIALGVPLDAKALVGDGANARVRIQGVIRGHEVKQVQWFPNEDPPRARATLRVPFWGAKGVATLFCEQQRGLAARRANRLPLIAEEADVSDGLLIIDARGLKTVPCLFPVVIDAQGRVIYDVSRIGADAADHQPVVRYVESQLTYRELSALCDEPGPQPRLASYQPADPGVAPATSQPASRPTTQPAEDRPGRRQRKRIVVRATEPAPASSTQIVLTAEDAEALRQTPEGASLLRTGRVVVVVDSAAAGIEGRGPAPEGQPQLALAIP